MKKNPKKTRQNLSVDEIGSTDFNFENIINNCLKKKPSTNCLSHNVARALFGGVCHCVVCIAVYSLQCRIGLST